MTGKWIAIFVVCMSASLAAVQAQEVPDGWYLHDELSPSLDLVYYDAAARDHELSMSCSEGYSDLVVAFYPDAPMSEQKYALALKQGGTAVTLDANGAVYNNRFVIDGIAIMDDKVADLLRGGFSVLVDGKPAKTFKVVAETKEHVDRFIDACLVD